MIPLTIILCAAVLGLFVALLVTVVWFKRALRMKQAECNRAHAAASKWFAKHEKVSARLAPFIAKRARDSKGHYISEKAA